MVHYQSNQQLASAYNSSNPAHVFQDQRQMFFCVNLDPPIKQGQTRYHYLVFSFMQEDETDLELPFTEEVLFILSIFKLHIIKNVTRN